MAEVASGLTQGRVEKLGGAQENVADSGKIWQEKGTRAQFEKQHLLWFSLLQGPGASVKFLFLGRAHSLHHAFSHCKS